MYNYDMQRLPYVMSSSDIVKKLLVRVNQGVKVREGEEVVGVGFGERERFKAA